ncbi:MAG: hypothetical protein IPG89_18490 [Bacteroidetes bacterium]|nr:hypothetical protein [Bacteroidota bacterium]
MGTDSVFNLFLKAIFSGLLNMGSYEWRVAGKELISKKTFRLPDSSYSDRLIGLRVFSRTFSNLKCEKKTSFSKHKILILDANWKVLQLRKEYLMLVKGYAETEIVGITKDISFAYAKNVSTKVCLICLSFFVLPFTFFSKNRVQWALIFSEFVEISAAVNSAIRMQVERIHFLVRQKKMQIFLT